MRERLPGDEGAFRQLVNCQKQRARKYEREFALTDTQLKILYKSSCYYCGIEPKQTFRSQSNGEPFIYNGIDRVDNTKGYTTDNVVPCCKPCNLVKSTGSVSDLIQPNKWYGNYLTIKRVNTTTHERIIWECFHNNQIKKVPARYLRQYQKLEK